MSKNIRAQEGSGRALGWSASCPRSGVAVSHAPQGLHGTSSSNPEGPWEPLLPGHPPDCPLPPLDILHSSKEMENTFLSSPKWSGLRLPREMNVLMAPWAHPPGCPTEPIRRKARKAQAGAGAQGMAQASTESWQPPSHLRASGHPTAT